jgi:SpoVK/Ycf46/Vps4 family AAA+-type ATPase
MVKRKIVYDDEDDDYTIDCDTHPSTETKKRKIEKKAPKLNLENCPSVSSLKDLINIGKTNKFYKNINNVMLWDILPFLEELDNMIGMKTLKESIFFQIIYYLQGMHDKNRNEEYLHSVILGNPGCGKTSVAKILGNIYKNMGILSSNAVFKIGHRDDFVGQYLGETSNKTKKFLTSCLGGVLFIDEVYSMGPGQKDKDSFSKEAIDTLCSFLSEHKNDFCCIIAGYEKDVKQCFFSVNSGLERRFPWTHIIEQYSPEDLTEIFTKMVADIKWELDKEINEKFLNSFFESNKNEFKNSGGDIENFISKCKMIHSKRVFSLGKEHKFKITKVDLECTLDFFKKYKLTTEVKPVYSYYT